MNDYLFIYSVPLFRNAVGNAYFGKGTGKIVMDDVHCTGTESTLTDCRHTTNHDCVHSEDAGVCCNDCCSKCEVHIIHTHTVMKAL